MGRATELAKSVEELFESLEREMDAFRTRTSLRCPSGCGACCTYPDIEATVLEFLPLVLALSERGQAEPLLERLQKEKLQTCVLYQPLDGEGQGRCLHYAHRGMICRLFGTGAIRAKDGRLQLVACRVLKTLRPEQIQEIQQNLAGGMPAPVMLDFTIRLAQLDPSLGSAFFPVNQAIQKAIEWVLLERAFLRESL